MVPAVVPKPEPLARTKVLHEPKVGSSEVSTGRGTSVGVDVDVGPAVLVGGDVGVGVLVAPSGA
jgi:hypothetical protein